MTRTRKWACILSCWTLGLARITDLFATEVEVKITREEKAEGSPNYGEKTVKITYESAFDGAVDWALFEPGKSETWVIVPHGHGSTGSQIFTRPDLAGCWLPAIREKGLGILSPNLRGNAWMCEAAVRDLSGLLKHAGKKYGARRFIIFSGSMGGTGALIYAARRPEDISGVFAGCPATDIGEYYRYCDRNKNNPPVLGEIAAAIEKNYGGPPERMEDAYKVNSVRANAAKFDMPVWLCHGDNDKTIPVEESRAFAKELERLGKKFVYVELKGGHHDSPLPEGPKALEWILKNLRE